MLSIVPEVSGIAAKDEAAPVKINAEDSNAVKSFFMGDSSILVCKTRFVKNTIETEESFHG